MVRSAMALAAVALGACGSPEPEDTAAWQLPVAQFSVFVGGEKLVKIVDQPVPYAALRVPATDDSCTTSMQWTVPSTMPAGVNLAWIGGGQTKMSEDDLVAWWPHAAADVPAGEDVGKAYLWGGRVEILEVTTEAIDVRIEDARLCWFARDEDALDEGWTCDWQARTRAWLVADGGIVWDRTPGPRGTWGVDISTQRPVCSW